MSSRYETVPVTDLRVADRIRLPLNDRLTPAGPFHIEELIDCEHPDWQNGDRCIVVFESHWMGEIHRGYVTPADSPAARRMPDEVRAEAVPVTRWPGYVCVRVSEPRNKNQHDKCWLIAENALVERR